MRRLSTHLVIFGAFLCLVGAIWSPEEGIKWVLSAVYLLLVGKWFGLNYKKEKVIGFRIERPNDEITDFLPARRRK